MDEVLTLFPELSDTAVVITLSAFVYNLIGYCILAIAIYSVVKEICNVALQPKTTKLEGLVVHEDAENDLASVLKKVVKYPENSNVTKYDIEKLRKAWEDYENRH